MATYITYDIYGDYDAFISLLEQINLQESDTLYILGNVINYGVHPIKVLLKLMEMPNVVCIAGKQEIIAGRGFELFKRGAYATSFGEDELEILSNIMGWLFEGGYMAMAEYEMLDYDTKTAVIDYIKDMIMYKKVEVCGKRYTLTHDEIWDENLDRIVPKYMIEDCLSAVCLDNCMKYCSEIMEEPYYYYYYL